MLEVKASQTTYAMGNRGELSTIPVYMQNVMIMFIPSLLMSLLLLLASSSPLSSSSAAVVVVAVGGRGAFTFNSTGQSAIRALDL